MHSAAHALWPVKTAQSMNAKIHSQHACQQPQNTLCYTILTQGAHTANSLASTTTDPPLQQPCVSHSRQALPLLASITYTPHSTTKHARRDRQMCHQESISRRARRSCPGRFFVRSGVSSSLDEGCCRGRRPRAPGAGIPYRSGAISTPLPLLP